MLATVSPSSLYIDDTLSTLQFTQRAQSIVNKASVNEQPQSSVIQSSFISHSFNLVQTSICNSSNHSNFVELMTEVGSFRRRIDETAAAKCPLAGQILMLKRFLLRWEKETEELLR